ncbi:MAG: ATP-binding protein [Acidimicrobiia bacterium]
MLLERETQIDTLVHLLDEAGQGRGSLALVAGEAGVGKTSLVKALADMVRNRSLVLVGACDPLSTPRPLSPLLDFAADPDSGLGDIVRLSEQHEIFGAFLARLRKSVRPVLTIIEDIHWADDATVDLVRFVGRRIANSKALVVVTYREDEVGRNHPLQVLLGDLAAAGSATKLAVPSLSTDAVRTLAAGRGFDADHLHRITGGNAFFVTEVIAAGQFVPSSVRDAVLARVLRLGEKAQQVVESVSIAPRALEVDKSLRLADASPNDVDEAVARGVLVGEGGKVRFRHELARTAVEDAIPPARRESLHQKMIDLLVEAGIDDPARLAHHATRAADRELIARYAPAAATDAMMRGANREAAQFLEAALECEDLLDDAADLRLRLASLLNLLDQQGDALRQAELAAAAYRLTANVAGVGRALTTVAYSQWASGNTASARPIIDEAVTTLESIGPSEDLASALYISSLLHMLARHHQPAMKDGESALRMAERVGSPFALARATLNLGTTELVTGVPERGLSLLGRSRQLLDEMGRSATTALLQTGSGGGEVRRYREAVAALEEAIPLSRQRDEDYSLAYNTAWLARIRFEQGRWHEAIELANEVDFGRQGTNPISRITAHSARGRVGVRRGGPRGIALLEEVSQLAVRLELQHRWPSIAGIAEYRWLIGAHDRITEVLTGPFAEALGTDSQWARGELGFWMWRAGLIETAPPGAAYPFALQMDGDWRKAASAWREIGCPYEEAMALADGDEAALLESLEILDGLGARPLASLVRKQLREQGANHIPRGPRPATKADKAGLTPRQREVLELMADGLTNAEIADRLYLTKKTVEHHVAAILQKTGVDSRAKAIASAKDGGSPMAI